MAAYPCGLDPPGDKGPEIRVRAVKQLCHALRFPAGGTVAHMGAAVATTRNRASATWRWWALMRASRPALSRPAQRLRRPAGGMRPILDAHRPASGGAGPEQSLKPSSHRDPTHVQGAHGPATESEDGLAECQCNTDRWRFRLAFLLL